jgi:putative zinc finger/helix-turn-helix YgiT family protein
MLPAMSVATLEGALHRLCGGRYALQTESVSVRLSGMSAEVTREYFRCEKCGHEQRTIDQRDAAERSAVEQIRAAHGLLAPKAIRQLRESLGLTVAQFAELCYGTPKGIVEGWEKGRYLQNREADQLLRSLADPAVLERRAAKAGVTLPVSPRDEPGEDAMREAPAAAEQPSS